MIMMCRYLTSLLAFLAIARAVATSASSNDVAKAPGVLGRDLPPNIEFNPKDPEGFWAKLLSSLEKIKSRPGPNSTAEVISRLKLIKQSSNPKGYVDAAAHLISQGLTTNDLEALATGFSKLNNNHNVNKRDPAPPIYPKKSPQDAPYPESEADLRRQIYIPSTFTYGKKPPVVLIPGTGERAGNSFAGNFYKTLRDKPYADPVLLNPDKYWLADAQDNGALTAYALNYISGISGGRNVTAVGWSQGSMTIQWALKYWPSVRKVVEGAIVFSGDYDGSLVANVLAAPQAVPLTPALLQQKYDSEFVKVLRSNGGDSAYVPTTTIYSGFFDEIVIPQQGKGASSYLHDARKVGVTNNEIQKICPRTSPAGSFVDHESVLFNALTHALVEDALTHGSPARSSRIDLKRVCEQLVAPGLSLDDVLVTESTIPFAVAQIALYKPKTLKEPKIKSYAR